MNKFLILLITGLGLAVGAKIFLSQNITKPSLADKATPIQAKSTPPEEVHTSIVVSPKMQDLGTVVYGDIAQTEFSLTNFTPTPLKITRVSTSCGCTSAAVEKEELQPYEETTVNVSFDPAVHKDDTDLGDVTRTIYINTDNPNFAQLTAEISAKVIKKRR